MNNTILTSELIITHRFVFGQIPNLSPDIMKTIPKVETTQKLEEAQKLHPKKGKPKNKYNCKYEDYISPPPLVPSYCGKPALQCHNMYGQWAVLIVVMKYPCNT